MRVLVTASRKMTDRDLIWDTLDGLYARWLKRRQPGEEFVVMHGGAAGGDSIADAWARQGLPYVVPDKVMADWELLGLHAGHERNGRMVAKNPCVVLAFPRGIAKGTRDCMKQARDAGIPVRRF